jgi:predicted transcriptional regulator
MLAEQIATNTYPNLTITDKVSYALQLMEDYDVQHLPVISSDVFVGIVSKEQLLDEIDSTALATIQHQLFNKSVLRTDHAMQALRLMSEEQITLIAVINEQQELIGTIHFQAMLQALHHFTGNDEPGGVIVFEMDKRNYSFGEISRLVETNDAYITQCNTSVETGTGLLLVTLKINRRELSDIIATFQRYDYTIRYYFGEEAYQNELKANYNALMNYLNM